MLINEFRKLLSHKVIFFFLLIFILLISFLNLMIFTDKEVRQDQESYEMMKDYPISDFATKKFNQLPLSYSSFVSGHAILAKRDSILQEDLENNLRKMLMPTMTPEDITNLEIENSYLKSISNLELVPYKTSFFEKYVDNSAYVWYLLVLIGLFLFYYLYYSDIDNGLIKVYSTYKSGLTKIFFVKLAVFILTTLAFMVIWMLLDVLILRINNINLDIIINNIPSFTFSPTNISILSYILQNILSLYFVMMLIVFIFALIVFVTRNTIFSAIITGVLIYFQYYFHTFIPVGNQLENLKYINVFTLLNSPFKSLKLSHLFGTTLLSEYWSIILILILTILTIFISSLSYSKQWQLRFPTLYTSKGFNSGNLAINEIYDFLVKRRYLILLLIVSVLAYQNVANFNISKDYDYDVVKRVRNHYVGDITEESFKELTSTYEQANQAHASMVEILSKENLTDEDQLMLQELNTKTSDLSGLKVVYDEYVEKMEDGATYYMNDEAYDIFFASKRPFTFIKNTSIASAFIAFCVILSLSHEYRIGISKLFNTMAKSKTRKMLKLSLYYFGFMLLFVITYIGQYFKVEKFFELKILDTSINNIFPTTSTISFAMFIALLIFGHLLFIVSFVNATISIAKRNTTINSIALSISLLLVIVTLFSINPLTSPLSLLRFELLGAPIAYGLMTLALIVLNVFLVKDFMAD